MAELISIVSHFDTKSPKFRFRNRVSILFQHFALLRSESVLGLELPDMFHIPLPNEGVSECRAVVLQMRSGKTNQFGKVEYGSFIRNKDVHGCPISALAMYFFYRWHCSGEAFPDTSSNDRWYLSFPS